MVKAVAAKGDVQGHVSSSPSAGSNNGAWSSSVPLVVVTDPRLTLNHVPVALSATESFAFAPGDTKSSAVATSISLTAGATKVTVGHQSVLVDGDKKDDATSSLSAPPNDISVSSQQKLRTA